MLGQSVIPKQIEEIKSKDRFLQDKIYFIWQIYKSQPCLNSPSQAISYFGATWSMCKMPSLGKGREPCKYGFPKAKLWLYSRSHQRRVWEENAGPPIGPKVHRVQHTSTCHLYDCCYQDLWWIKDYWWIHHNSRRFLVEHQKSLGCWRFLVSKDLWFQCRRFLVSKVMVSWRFLVDATKNLHTG